MEHFNEKSDHKHAQDHNQGGRLPEHLEEMNRVHADIDVIETTTQSPYKEPNFIGTYIAIAFATCGAFAGFVMPITSIALINAEIGEDVFVTLVVG